MQFSFGDDIRESIFLAFRALAAAGGFIAGWLLSGPASRLVWRLAFHRPVPQFTQSVSRWIGGLLLALIVFLCLPLGWGGGGGGSGGGTGPGVGPFAGDEGTGAPGKKGPSASDAGKKGEQPGAFKNDLIKEVLVIELLGGDAVKENKYYLIDRKGAAVDTVEMAKYLDDNLQRLMGIDIVLTDKSVGEAHQAVRQLQGLAQERKLRTLIVMPKDA